MIYNKVFEKKMELRKIPMIIGIELKTI